MGERIDTERVPARCDGCRRDAVTAGMARHGWIVRPDSGAFAGRYCLSCATVLRTVDRLVTCSECGETVEDESPEHRGWTYWWSTAAGDLQPYCADCAASEFGHGAER